MKRFSHAATTSLCLATAIFVGGCGHEAEPPGDQATATQEAIQEADEVSGRSITATVDINFAPPRGSDSFNIRETPERTSDPYANLCGKSGSFALTNAVVVVSSGSAGFDGDWVSIAGENLGENPCQGSNVWINGQNVNMVTATLPDGNKTTYSANDQGQFIPGTQAPANALPAGPDWMSLTQVMAGIGAVQNAASATP